MENLTLFMAENKKKTENVFYAATESLCDGDGKPLEWEFQPLSSDGLVETLKRHGKEVNEVVLAVDMLCEMVVNPPLNSSSLQDSYGVKTPEELLKKMVDNSAEFSELISFAFDLSGYGKEKELREQAKNS